MARIERKEGSRRGRRLAAEFSALRQALRPAGVVYAWAGAEELVIGPARLSTPLLDDEEQEHIAGIGFTTIERFAQRHPERGPDRYIFVYRCKGVHVLEGGGRTGAEIIPATRHYIEVVFPPSYPASEPIVIAHSRIWHPNVHGHFICKADRPFAVSVTLPMICDLIGRMIQYLHYNLRDDANPAAVEWAKEKERQGSLPLDRQMVLVDLKAVAGAVDVAETVPTSDLVELGN